MSARCKVPRRALIGLESLRFGHPAPPSFGSIGKMCSRNLPTGGRSGAAVDSLQPISSCLHFLTVTPFFLALMVYSLRYITARNVCLKSKEIGPAVGLWLTTLHFKLSIGLLCTFAAVLWEIIDRGMSLMIYWLEESARHSAGRQWDGHGKTQIYNPCS